MDHRAPRAYPNGIQIMQPGVARHELPWDRPNVLYAATLKGVESRRRTTHGTAMAQSLTKILLDDARTCIAEFQDEFRQLLRRHEIEFDERYVWD